MKLSYAVDINQQLSRCEEIADKYIGGHEGFLFIPGMRYPINGLSQEKKDKLLKYSNNIVSSFPYMPYKCLPCVKALLLWWLHGDTIKDKELFKTNPLYVEGKKNFYSEYMLNISTDEIIRHYIEDITDDDILVIDNEVMNLYESAGIKRMFGPYIDHLYEIDDEGRIIIIKLLGHIKEKRFEEVREQKEIEHDLKGE